MNFYEKSAQFFIPFDLLILVAMVILHSIIGWTGIGIFAWFLLFFSWLGIIWNKE